MTKADIQKLHGEFPFPHLGNAGMFIGADPEIFVVDGNKQIIPAFNFLPNQNKSNKMRPDLGIYYSLHNDGFQAEFTIQAEACLNFLSTNIAQALYKLYSVARKINPHANLLAVPMIDVMEEILLAAPAQYVQMGCSPSLNAYGLRGEAIVDGKAVPIRFAGSHMHFGVDKKARDRAPEIIKAIDCVAGVMSVALFAGSGEKTRRKFYGLPGEFRLPKHGIEYRSISARMLSHPVYYHLLFDSARFALNMAGEKMAHWWSTPEETVVKCMLGCNRKLARQIIKSEPIFEEFLRLRYGMKGAKVLRLLLGEAKLKDKGFLRNWRMNGNLNYSSYHASNPNCCVSTAEIS